MDQKFLNTDQCADLLKRTPNSIRRLVWQGKLPFRKVAGRLMFLEYELMDFIENSPGKRSGDILGSLQDF